MFKKSLNYNLSYLITGEKVTLDKAKKLIEEYGKNLTYTEECPELIAEEGRVSWEITHGLSTSNVVAGLFNSEGEEVKKDLTILNPNKILISWESEHVAASEFSVLVVRGGASSGIRIDEHFSLTSTNPVWNATITEVVYELNKMLQEFNSGAGVE